jgi:hypothetical protein
VPLEAHSGLAVVAAAAAMQQQHLAVYHVWRRPAAAAVHQGSSGCNCPRLVQAAVFQQAHLVATASSYSSKVKVQIYVGRLQLRSSCQGRVVPAWMEAVNSLQ